MNKIVKYITIIIFCTAGAVYGQAPASVTVGGVTYFQHGFNSDGGPYNNALTSATQPSPAYPGWQTREIRDSVTVTSTVKYYVLPNASLNPGFNHAVSPTDNVTSTFDWSLSVTSLGAFMGATDADNKKPLIEIKWGNTPGNTNLIVEEVPAGQTCDVLPTSIPIVIIPKPTIAFKPNTEGQPYMTVKCFSVTEDVEEFLHTFDMLVTTASSQIEISYTVTRDNIDVPELAENDVKIVDGKFPFTFPDELGEYVIKITKVTDRVARKSDVDGDVANITEGGQFTFRIFREIQTSPIYRVPNNF